MFCQNIFSHSISKVHPHYLYYLHRAQLHFSSYSGDISSDKEVLLFTKQRLDTVLLFTMQRLDTGVDKDFIHILFPPLPLNTEFSSLSSHLVILSHDGTDLNTLKTAVETLYHINQSLSSCITESDDKFGWGTRVAPFQLSDCFSSALL